MKPIKIAVGTLALALSAAVPWTMAQGWEGGGYGGCPGMMGGGYGYGPGMMGGGYGYGAEGGMMGAGPYSALDLSEEQRSQVNRIHDQVRKQHWDLMGKMRDESDRLQNLMAGEKPDPAAVGKQQMRIAELQRQMLESGVDAHNRINALLTPEQRQRMRNYGPGWRRGGE